MKYYWMSFVDDKKNTFQGVCVVSASNSIAAIKKAHDLGINPGGNVSWSEIDAAEYKRIKAAGDVNKLLTKKKAEHHAAEYARINKTPEHSPAPWKIETDLPYPSGGTIDITFEYGVICGVFSERGDALVRGIKGNDPVATQFDILKIASSEEVANARLIAASPDILAALRELVDVIDPGGPGKLEPFFVSPVAKARAAIKRAEKGG